MCNRSDSVVGGILSETREWYRQRDEAETEKKRGTDFKINLFHPQSDKQRTNTHTDNLKNADYWSQ